MIKANNRFVPVFATHFSYKSYIFQLMLAVEFVFFVPNSSACGVSFEIKMATIPIIIHIFDRNRMPDCLQAFYLAKFFNPAYLTYTQLMKCAISFQKSEPRFARNSFSGSARFLNPCRPTPVVAYNIHAHICTLACPVKTKPYENYALLSLCL